MRSATRRDQVAMNILIVCNYFPMPDRQADLLRLSHMLRMLRLRHQVSFFAHHGRNQSEHWGAGVVQRYKDDLVELGVKIVERIVPALETEAYDVVMFEYYTFAVPYLAQVRWRQPQARILVDTIDLAYVRLTAKAGATKKAEDVADAERVKRIELGVYASVDAILTISDAEKAMISKELPSLPVDTIPLIIDVRPYKPRSRLVRCSLIFVGNFAHRANVDAIIFFCKEILPLIAATVPATRVDVVGNDAPPEVQLLASEHVFIRGYVQDLAALYEASDIAIAPLTWGGGLKGKVAEAMLHGLPVVTTTVGAAGFDLDPDSDALVRDSPQGFAEAVLRLFASDLEYERVRANGWRLAKERYSYEAVCGKLLTFFDALLRLPVKKGSFLDEMRLRLGDAVEHHLPCRSFLEKHVLWRFNRFRRKSSAQI